MRKHLRGGAFLKGVVRQMVECVKVFDGGKVEVVFEGGYVVEEQV